MIDKNKELARLWIEEGWNKNRNFEISDQVFAHENREKLFERKAIFITEKLL
jgi:hypothetical protein